MVDELTEHLKDRGYQAEGLHGDLSQNQRDTVMNLFRSGKMPVLIATDVAARGIDVDDVEAVFNYDVPEDIEYYVHRIGRTGIGTSPSSSSAASSASAASFSEEVFRIKLLYFNIFDVIAHFHFHKSGCKFQCGIFFVYQLLL